MLEFHRRQFTRARTIEDACPHCRVHQRFDITAEMSQRITNRLIGDLGIALTGHDIHRCLAADKLRQRRHHDGKAILGPHLHCLLHRRRQAVFGTDFAQLIAQIGNHAAGNLMDVLRVVIGHRLADGKALAAGDGGEVPGHRTQAVFVDIGFIAHGTQIGRDIEQRGQRGIIGQRRQRSVDNADALLHRLKYAQRAQAGGAMGMHFNRDAGGMLQHQRHQGAGALWRQQSARILQAQAERLELDCRLGALDVVLVRVAGRNGIGDVDDGPHPGSSGCTGTQGPHLGIVPGVRDPHLLDTGCGHDTPEQFHH